MQSEIEMLKGRVEALEKAKQSHPSIVVWDGVSSDTSREDTIFKLIMEEGFALNSVETEALKRGIRKAMNHFYRGPQADLALRDQVQALIKERDILEARLYNVKLALGVEEDKLE